MIDTKQMLSNNAMYNLTYVTDLVCPQCGGEMRAWKHGKGGNVCTHEEERDGKKIWTGCGFRELKQKAQKEADYKYHKIKSDEVYEYLRRNSVVGNPDVLKRKLDTFVVNNDLSKTALEKSQLIVNELINKNPIHILLTGVTGTGKTHLSVGIANEYLEKSKYSRKVMFISYSELYVQMQTMFQIEGAAKEIEKNILSEIKKADLVIIDDLGAELGTIGSNKQQRATESNVRLLNRILDAREDKNLIVTTNFSGEDISREYGQRCLSRIMKHLKDDQGVSRVIKTNGLRDFRTR